MARLEEQVVIDAPPESVFELLANPERGPEWTPNLVRVEPVDGAGGPTRISQRKSAPTSFSKPIGLLPRGWTRRKREEQPFRRSGMSPERGSSSMSRTA